MLKKNVAGVPQQLIVKITDDMDYTTFVPLMLGAVCKEDLQQFNQQEQIDLVQQAVQSLIAYQTHNFGLHINISKSTRGGKPIAIITIVNQNKPFLLDSVLNTINEAKLKLYMVTHPIIDLLPGDNEDGAAFLVSKAQSCSHDEANKHRLSLMQFAVENMSEEAEEQLKSKLHKALNAVGLAVAAWPDMVARVKEVAASYQAFAASKKDVAKEAVAEFLLWLLDNNFTFLGLGEYKLVDGKLTAVADKLLGIDLPKELSGVQLDRLLTITKADKRSKVHRFAWLEDIYVKILSTQTGESSLLRVVGLFTTTAYTNSVFSIPYLRDKAHIIVDQLGYNIKDHSGKALLHILEHYPRDEMFRADVAQLAENAWLILQLVDRPRLRVLSHQLHATSFVTSLIYLPKAQYNINNCEKIGSYLLEAYEGDFYEYSSFFMSAAITRVYYIIHRRASGLAPQIERKTLERAVASITRSWEDSLTLEASEQVIDETIVRLAATFPLIYRDSFNASSALEDAKHILELGADKPLSAHFYRSTEPASYKVSLKLYHRETALMLSERVPLLENMGFKVINEQSFELLDENNQLIYMHFMQLEHATQGEAPAEDAGHAGQAGHIDKNNALLNTTFEQAWAEQIDDDAYNKLCQSARLAPREVLIMRIYGRYLQQIGIAYSQTHLANALNAYGDIARDLYEMFYQTFSLDVNAEQGAIKTAQARSRIEEALQKVPNLDDDLILRRYVNLIEASLRTNAFARIDNGELRQIIAIKFDPRLIDSMPQPKPYREIFVYGMQVEGVHLRFGPVARGGIRWSDRPLDYRTEVLGLVKAQQVKNVVIVPVGSKGGFYPRQLPQNADRAQLSEAARQAYIGYIDAMLSITDNLLNGEVVPPKDVKRSDGDDPYFVVAADKGTASFSDTANAISQSHGFWLDDAFASGGSDGYDHKKMSITAKGTWEAVKRHFREMFDHDIQTKPFSVVGVGDMSGDVFGNGMLLSTQIKLIAAFDHRDIFIDPNPDIAISYAERQRLFNLERSSWQDYDISKLSTGGGVFSRSQKEIKLSSEAAAAIGLTKTSGTPFEIVNAILKADVDLLWFGGIGTYVRAISESDIAVGDRTNDNVRITGNQLRAKTIGEGANLGLTQRARIEYSMAGGRCDTDAIDNSAGVNCSDVEVNIKIALADAMRSGSLTRPERNELLKSMTDDVAKLVLYNNYRQSLLLSLSQSRAVQDLPQQMRFMSSLESQGRLDRNVEILPSDSALKERLLHGQALTRPELSVLMAYAKLSLQDELTQSDFLDDDYFKARLFNYFPPLMQKKFAIEIERHQLRRAIIATLLANSIVNSTGSTFAYRLADKAGANIIEVTKAYITIHDGFAIEHLVESIDNLDNIIPGQLQNELYKEVMLQLAYTIELFLSMRKTYPTLSANYSLSEIVEKMTQAHAHLYNKAKQILPSQLFEMLEQKRAKYESLAVPEELARKLSFLQITKRVAELVLMSTQESIDLDILSRSYFKISTIFRIDQIEEASNAIAVIDYYDDMALARAKDNIGRILCQITVNIVQSYKETEDPVAAWLTQKASEIEPITSRMNALIEADLNISRFVVAASMMGDLLELSQ